jgi:gamma-glutamylcyclotransferase (GGCT)/AIG2-like uncharacterized protein YtfP
MNEVRLFVYGTLRKGESNHLFYLQGALEEGITRVNGFSMFALRGYPFVLPDPTGSIEVESYLVTTDMLERIDLLELFLGAGNPENEYERIEVTAQNGLTGFLYVYADATNADTRYPIENGNWPEYRTKHQFGFCS